MEDHISVKFYFESLESSIISLIELSEKNVNLLQEAKSPYIQMNEKKENLNLLKFFESAPTSTWKLLKKDRKIVPLVYKSIL